MSRSDQFAIECADGTAITLYVSAALPAEQWRSVRQAVDELPATVRARMADSELVICIR